MQPRRLPPLQRCRCGRSYRSWKPEAGCGQPDCRAMPSERGWLREMQVRMGNRLPSEDDAA